MARKRSPNFLQSEKELFTTLLDEFSSRIECKRTDAMTQNEKAKAWEQLHQKFNSQSTYIERSIENLKSLWDNLKAQARKALANEKQDIFSTGGGVADPRNKPTPVDESVISVIGKSATGLQNAYDHDSMMLNLPHFEVESMAEVAGLDGEVQITTIEQADLAKALEGAHLAVDWSQFKAPLLMTPKAAPLKIASTSTPATSSATPATPTPSTSSSNLKKRNLSEEAEYLKNVKRRRPVIEESKKKEEMYAAKAALALVSKETVLEEKERAATIFEIEKKKKELEVQMMELQLKKMKKDLGMED